MNNNEDFAYKVGIMARLYIDFKNEVEERSGSLRDLLTYSKYDREKLRFVLRRIVKESIYRRLKKVEKNRLQRKFLSILLMRD